MLRRSELRVAICQYSARNETPSDRICRVDRLLSQHRRETFDLIVCPELFASGYEDAARVVEHTEPQDGPVSLAMSALAERHGTTVVYGYPEADGDRRFNSALAIGPSGQQANHRKLRLAAGQERELFEGGESHTWFEVAGWRVALLICYDVEFPEAVRACAVSGADLILVPTALMARWAFVARHLVPTRAFENGVFVAYANYSGHCNGVSYLGESCIIGPDGTEIQRAGSDETFLIGALAYEEIAHARRRLAYLDDRRGLDAIRVPVADGSALSGA